MIEKLLRTLQERFFPPPLALEQREQQDARDEERISWIDTVIFHLHHHTKKKVRFIFSPTKNHVTCIVKMGKAKDAPETMIDRPFPETEWSMFWPLLVFRLQEGIHEDIRIYILSTPLRPNESYSSRVIPYLVECRIEKHWRWRNTEKPVGLLWPNFS